MTLWIGLGVGYAITVYISYRLLAQEMREEEKLGWRPITPFGLAMDMPREFALPIFLALTIPVVNVIWTGCELLLTRRDVRKLVPDARD